MAIMGLAVDITIEYKAKPFVDTFGYRAGDASGALLERTLGGLSSGMLPLAAAVIELAIGWIALCSSQTCVTVSFCTSH